MSKLNIKKFIATIMVLFVILCFNFITFSKTIDLNGINVSLNVETIKKQVGNGVDVKDNNKFSDTEYEKDVKETKDDSVSVELNIKNSNPYEACNITITEKVNGGFKQSNNVKLDKTINLKLNPNENKTYKYNYKYNKNFLKEQFNKFFSGNDDKVAYEENGKIKEDREKTKIVSKGENRNNNDDKNSINLTKDIKNNDNKYSSKVIFIVLIIILVVTIIGVLFYMFFYRIKDQEGEYDDRGFSKFSGYNGFNVIAMTLILSMLVSICFNNKVLALDYIPNIYEKGQSFTKEVTKSVVFNERYYNFTYEIKVKYENKNEITDYETDTDGDGLSDALEYIYMTDKEKVDTDGDGLSDYLEVMVLNYNPKSKWTFNDGINDGYRDYDEDGLRNKKEVEIGTDLILYDTDGDNIDDYEEVNGVKSKDGVNTYITSPLLVDTDEDGVNDDIEVKLGLDPTNNMTDGITPDVERKINQTYDLGKLSNELIYGTFPITSISGNITGLIDDNVKIKEYSDANFENSKLIIGNPLKIELTNDTDKVRLSVDCSSYGNRVKKLMFVKYENSEMIPIETTINSYEVSAEFGSGEYGIIDVEMYLRKMNIYIGDYD